VQVPGMVLNVPEKSAFPCAFRGTGVGRENGLIFLARIANQRALNLINRSRSAGGIATIQHESIDIEGNMSGR